MPMLGIEPPPSPLALRHIFSFRSRWPCMLDWCARWGSYTYTLIVATGTLSQHERAFACHCVNHQDVLRIVVWLLSPSRSGLRQRSQTLCFTEGSSRITALRARENRSFMQCCPPGPHCPTHACHSNWNARWNMKFNVWKRSALVIVRLGPVLFFLSFFFWARVQGGAGLART